MIDLLVLSAIIVLYLFFSPYSFLIRLEETGDICKNFKRIKPEWDMEKILKSKMKRIGKCERCILFYNLIGFLIVILAILSKYLPLTSWISFPVARLFQKMSEFLILVVLLFGLVSFLLSVVSFIFLMVIRFSNKKLIHYIFIHFAFSGIIISFFLILQKLDYRKFILKELGTRSMILINAIKTFEIENGFPPSRLNDITPKYMKQIPHTGVSAYPYYEYELLKKGDGELYKAWYDLGSRDGKPMEGLWVYPFGKGGHSIAMVVFDRSGKIHSFNLDRLPHDIRKEKFSIESWKNNPSKRLNFIHDFYLNIFSPNILYSELKKYLGEPNQIIKIKRPSWELRIVFGKSLVGRGVFFYWPTEDYSKRIYGGVIEIIGKWAFLED